MVASTPIESESTTAPVAKTPSHWPKYLLGSVLLLGAVTLLVGTTAATVFGVGIPLAAFLRTLPEVQGFIAQYPGTGKFNVPVSTGFPIWLRLQHYFNRVLLFFIMRSGLQILADHPRLSLDANCTPDSEFFRLRGAVPKDRVWTAKNDTVALPG